MIYGFKSGDMTVAAAGTSIVELEGFYQKFAEIDGNADCFVEHRATTFMDHLGDADFKGFKHPVYVFTHADPAQQDAFVAAHEIALNGRNFCVDRHADMMREVEKDPYDAQDIRTISEMHDLEAADRWDTRTDEQKELDAKYKALAKDAKARGDMSGDSFDPNQNKEKKGQVHVTDVRLHHDADGEIVIDEVLGVKGLYEEEGTEIDHEAAARMEAERQAAIAAALAVPRPWHDGTIVNLSDAERAELPKQYEAKEFLMCGEHSHERGTYITITPRSYFDAHGKPWDGKLEIGHLLPADVKEVEDGLYHTKSRNWLEISHVLADMGFKESLLLQIWLNNQ